MERPVFEPFPKIARLNRDSVITEKIDGTNASILITEDGDLFPASRTRWISPEDDNAGFARWVEGNRDELLKLGVGHHFGEWWGQGIQRGYGLKEKRFSLFNVSRWADDAVRPECCHVVPLLYAGKFTSTAASYVIDELREIGSRAAPGFMRPEGVMVWHEAARTYFKVTVEKDELSKAEAERKAAWEARAA